jgi:hypothetical protein
VAYIRGEEAEVYVFFSAAFPNPGETQVMHLRLEKTDGDALLRWLQSHGNMKRLQ